jgi:arsenate reductase
MSVTLYGIPNCDTVKRSRTWLDANQITYAFHDYKKFGVDAEKLARWIERASLGKVLNRAGTTFRKLDEADKSGLDEAKAIVLMVAQPSLIKRPIVEYPGGLLIGFIEPEWISVFAPK